MSLNKKINKLEAIAITNKDTIREEEEEGEISWKEFGVGLGILTGNPITSIMGLIMGDLLDRLYDTHRDINDIIRSLPKNLSKLLS